MIRLTWSECWQWKMNKRNGPARLTRHAQIHNSLSYSTQQQSPSAKHSRHPRQLRRSESTHTHKHTHFTQKEVKNVFFFLFPLDRRTCSCASTSTFPMRLKRTSAQPNIASHTRSLPWHYLNRFELFEQPSLIFVSRTIGTLREDNILSSKSVNILNNE